MSQVVPLQPLPPALSAVEPTNKLSYAGLAASKVVRHFVIADDGVVEIYLSLTDTILIHRQQWVIFKRLEQGSGTLLMLIMFVQS